MDAFGQYIVETLRQYGLPGLVIFGLGYAVYRLYNRNEKLNDTIQELGRDAVKANESVTSALDTMSEVNKSTNSSIQLLSGGVQNLLWRQGGFQPPKAGE
jgi:hypothetical protein